MSSIRYIAVAWNPADPAAAERAESLERVVAHMRADWRRTDEVPGLLIVTACPGCPHENIVHLLAHNQGVVVGKLFRKSSDGYASCSSRANCREFASACPGTPEALARDFWGHYVGFLSQSERLGMLALRDPLGGLHAYVLRERSLSIFASSVDDLVQLGIRKPSINWDYVAAHAVDPDIRSSETGLQGFEELLPGQCVDAIDGHLARRFYWHPISIANSEVIEDVSVAASHLRTVTQSCVHAWVSNHRRVLLKLSGGLDSSIVLSCLNSAPSHPEIVCVTDHSQGSDTDERHFSRIAAAKAGIRLIERERYPHADLRRMSEATRSATPPVPRSTYYCKPSDAELAHELGASAVVTGLGGDQLFYQSQFAFVTTDFAFRRGLCFDLWRIALETAYSNRTFRYRSVWGILARAIRFGLLTPSTELASPEKRGEGRVLISSSVRAAWTADRWRHPWFTGVSSVAPGKLRQAHGLALPPYFSDASDVTTSILHPLISQPLVELCLRIPTYVLASGGRERAVARRAFADAIPAEILARRTKGGITEHVWEVLLRNSGVLREFLCDGLLVKHGILNGDAVRKALGQASLGLNSSILEIMDHFATETWVRGWTNA